MVVSRRILKAFEAGGVWDFAEGGPRPDAGRARRRHGVTAAHPVQLGSRLSGSRRHSRRPWAS